METIRLTRSIGKKRDGLPRKGHGRTRLASRWKNDGYQTLL